MPHAMLLGVEFGRIRGNTTVAESLRSVECAGTIQHHICCRCALSFAIAHEQTKRQLFACFLIFEASRAAADLQDGFFFEVKRFQ